MQGDSDERLRERLAALRRVTVKRGATRAEAATAKRLADQLAARLGKRPSRRRRKGPQVALPEPPGWRRKRLWLLWLEAALDKIAWAASILHGFWIASLAILIIVPVLFGLETAIRFSALYLARGLILIAVALLLGLAAMLLAVAAWWLRTLPGERLRATVLWTVGVLPFGLITIIWVIATVTFDAVMGKGLMIEICSLAISVPAAALGLAWYHWGHPVLQRKLGSIWCDPRCKFGRAA
jgi:hypothetical protein